MRHHLRKSTPFEEFAMYVGSTKEKLSDLLSMRMVHGGSKGDLKRAEVLGIPKEAAHEFCSLTMQGQIEENNRVAKAIEKGIVPTAFGNVWWWTTINCLGRPEEIKLANEVESFYKQLERKSSPGLLKVLLK